GIVTVDPGEHRVRRNVMAVRRRLEDTLHDILEDAAVFGLGLPKRLLDAVMAGDGIFQFRQVPSKFELSHHLSAEGAKRLREFCREATRRAIQHTQCADHVSRAAGGEWNSRVSARADFASDPQSRGKSFIRYAVLHNEQPTVEDCGAAKGPTSRSL